MIVVHDLNEAGSQRIPRPPGGAPGPLRGRFYQRDARTNLAPEELREIHRLRESPVITEGDRVIAESYSHRLLENFVPRCDRWLPLSQISSSNAQGDRFQPTRTGDP
jgi:hypothetical protein